MPKIEKIKFKNDSDNKPIINIITIINKSIINMIIEVRNSFFEYLNNNFSFLESKIFFKLNNIKIFL